MIRTWLRAGVFAAALTGAIAVALALGQQRRSTAPANGTVVGPVATPRPDRPSRAEVEPQVVARPAPQAAAATMDFYNVRTKATVAVPLDRVRKRRTVKVGDDGRRQERFAAIAELESDDQQLRLFKFISRAAFDALDVPEEEA